MLLRFPDLAAVQAFRAALNKAANLPEGKHGTRRWRLADGAVLCAVPPALEAAARATGLVAQEVDPTKADLSAPPTLARYVTDAKAEYDGLPPEGRYLLKLRIERGEARRAGKVMR